MRSTLVLSRAFSKLPLCHQSRRSSTAIPSPERLSLTKITKLIFIIYGLACDLDLTIRSNQSIFLSNCIKVTNSMKFAQVVSKIPCSQTFSNRWQRHKYTPHKIYDCIETANITACLKAHLASAVLVTMVTCATWLTLARASPRKPYVATVARSSKQRILLVVNLSQTISMSSRCIMPATWYTRGNSPMTLLKQKVAQAITTVYKLILVQILTYISVMTY